MKSTAVLAALMAGTLSVSVAYAQSCPLYVWDYRNDGTAERPQISGIKSVDRGNIAVSGSRVNVYRGGTHTDWGQVRAPRHAEKTEVYLRALAAFILSDEAQAAMAAYQAGARLLQEDAAPTFTFGAYEAGRRYELRPFDNQLAYIGVLYTDEHKMGDVPDFFLFVHPCSLATVTAAR